MNNNIIEIQIPEDLRNAIQRADIEYQSRRNILIYIMENNINIPQERIDQYQKDCDDKFMLFNNLKNILEQQYVIPNTKNQKSTWNLDYISSILTINFIEG